MTGKKIVKKNIVIIFALAILMALSAGIMNHSYAATNVASLTIFSDGSGDCWGTHAFLYIKNTSDSNITVLSKKVKPDEGVTVGTFGNKSEGKGIYINLEGHFIKEYDAYSPRVSLTTSLTKSELSDLNAKMKECNKWSYTKNCAWFAVKAWNEVAPSSKRLSAGIIKNPATLSANIKKNSTYKKKKSVTGVDTNYIKRYKTDNTIENVSSATKKSGRSSSGSGSR